MESSISVTSYSGSPSMTTGAGGGSVQFGIVFGTLGSNIETWKTGWTARMLSGKRSMTECIPAQPMISNRPRYFTANFFEGRVVRKN